MTRTTLSRLARPLGLAVLTLGIVGGAATIASADQNDTKMDTAEAQALQSASKTLGDAVTAAEANTGGKAISAEFDLHDSGNGAYKVEVVKADGTTQYVSVDPTDGSVKAMAADSNHDQADDDNGNDSDKAENTQSN